VPLTTTPDKALNVEHLSTLSLAGAEIAAFDPASDRVMVTSGDGLQIVDLSDPSAPSLLSIIDFEAAPFGFSNDINSVAFYDGVFAVAIAAPVRTDPGNIYFIDANGTLLNTVEVGSVPDNVVFSPDGSKLLVANEGEATETDDVEDGATFVNPEGSISVIDLSGGVAAATVQTADFGAFNGEVDTLIAQGVRLFVNSPGFEGTTVAQDLEPEYIAIAPDGLSAFVTLQEANSIAVVDLSGTPTVTDVIPLGLKDWNGLPVDFSDKDGGANFTTDNDVFGMFMPDAIASYTGNDGKTYYVIANEGDDRDDFTSESERLKDLDLDDALFPNEAALLADEVLGRLNTPQLAGVSGDTDGDGDLDQILAYGGRSFSILDADGNMVFDSGSHLDQAMFENLPGNFNDGRADNKGSEPEGVTIEEIDGNVYAFISLERFHATMIYDITDPVNPIFTNFAVNAGDENPEASILIGAMDSPNGENLLLVTNEDSETLTVYEITPTEPAEDVYTLQLLHFADGEAGLLASQTAPNLAALVDVFEDGYANSITLAGGDNFIPGPFYAAGADPSIGDVLPGGSTQGRIDIAIHNEIGVQASTIGNHEFDFGSRGFRDAFRQSGDWEGADFPYLSANLDFSGDFDLNGSFTETLGVNGLENAEDFAGKIVPSAVIEENGENIGIVGVTTQLLEQISSPTGTEVKGFPTGPGANGEVDDMALLAAQLQPYVDDLVAQGVNKIILMSHLQLIGNEQALAPLLEGVDIILAAGSNTRLGDADDVAAAFPGHDPDFAGTYPIQTTGADGKTTVIVNTDNEYTYLGRLVVDFDENGEIISESLIENVSINGAYAATDENVAEAWDVSVEELETTAFAEGTRGDAVRDLTDAVQAVIDEKSGNVFGFSEVYLEGARAAVRNEETNLGDVSADANADAARDALGLSSSDVVVSLKNGGGIRSQIGTTSAPDPIDGTVDFLPNPGGAVSQLDVENTLRFNNALIVFDTTPQGLLNILNNPAATTANNGGFFQLGGVQVSYDPDLPAGERIQDIALVDENGNKTAAIVNDGMVVPGAPETITMVTLNFTANGGDGYPIRENGSNFRFLLDDGTVSTPVDPEASFLDAAPANALGEQQAFADYFAENFGTPESAFNIEDTDQLLDLRIQNQNEREDTVLEGLLTEGTDGADKLTGDALDDLISGGAGQDRLFGFDGDDNLSGGDDADHLFGGNGNDAIDGDDGNDIMHGQNGDDVLNGGDGNDRMAGGADNDTLIGGAGQDSLIGGDGDDLLIGGLGRDGMTGGAGADTFRFETLADSSPVSRDFIRDFSSLEGDILDLSAIDAIVGGADDAFTLVSSLSGVAGELAVSYNVVYGSAYINGDIDGDGVADFGVTLKNVSALSQSDFIL